MGTRSRIHFGRVLLALAVLITAVLAVRAGLNYTTGRKLEAALAIAKAEGRPISARDIAPPPCPDDENAAALWKAAEALLVLPEGKAKQASVNAMESLFDGPALEGESRKALSDWVAKNLRAVDLVIEASSRPCFVYGPSDAPLWDKPIPNATKLLHAARLLAARALLEADGPSWKTGLDGCVHGMRFFGTLARGDGSVLIMGLVTIADLKMLIAGLDRVVQGRTMDTADLLSLLKELDVASWQGTFIRSVRTDAVLGLEWGLARIAGDPRVLDQSPFFGSKRLERFWDWLTRPALKTNLRQGLEWLGEVDKLLPLPYPEQRDAFDRLVTRLRPDLEDKDLLDEFLIWDHRPAFMKEATLEAMMHATRAGLACKAFRNVNRRYPERLEELVPSLLPEVPLDPFSGKPLIYRLSGDGILIYSVGSNGRDDGGRQTYQITKLVMEKDDDWTWRESLALMPSASAEKPRETPRRQ